LFEEFLSSSETFSFVKCPKCGIMSLKQVCVCKVNVLNEDAPHIRESVNALLDMETAHLSDKAHVRELAAHPTRSNLKRYLKAEGLRYAENEGGAPPRYKRPEAPDTSKIVKELIEKKRKRDGLEVRS
jgi:hypothetical protein